MNFFPLLSHWLHKAAQMASMAIDVTLCCFARYLAESHNMPVIEDELLKRLHTKSWKFNDKHEKCSWRQREAEGQLRIDTKALLFLHVYHICHHCYVIIQFNLLISLIQQVLSHPAKCIHFKCKISLQKSNTGTTPAVLEFVCTTVIFMVPAIHYYYCYRYSCYYSY